MTKRTYKYHAFLERKDGSFIAADRLWQIVRDPEGDLEKLKELVSELTPESQREFARWCRDDAYRAEQRLAALQAQLGGRALGPTELIR
jgi:hypothetical protein